MRTKTLAGALSVSFVVSGCAAPAPRLAAQTCPPDCKVEVQVGENCVISDPGAIRVAKPNMTIRWDLTRTNFHFARNGISIAGDSRQEFTRDAGQSGAKVEVFHDKNTFKKDYKYSITVEKDSGSACPTLDPPVWNDP
jgi:hypothetical protein